MAGGARPPLGGAQRAPGCRGPGRWLAFAWAALALLGAPAARADFLSPGDLAKQHKTLEGLANCTKCHVQGGQLAEEKCLECHAEIKLRVLEKRGFHGRMTKAERACSTCHKDHQGRDFQMIDWSGPKKAFEHKKTGWPLVGKHKGPVCTACHEVRLVQDEAVKKLVAQSQFKRETQLGLPTNCASCHFDDHRGQLDHDCKKCHDELAFKGAKSFSHEKTSFPLTGKHAPIECIKCHAKQPAPPVAAGTFPAPRLTEVQKFKPVLHASCLDCHKDPHETRFGNDCERCHVTSGWKDVKTGAGTALGERGFHDKTKFALKGAHAQVSCKACHGPFGKLKVQFKGLVFEKCTDCHADGHVGQLGATHAKSAECTRCHDETAFVPARFDLDDHQKTKYLLEGAHKAAACQACHQRDPSLERKAPAAVVADLKLRGRPLRVSTMLLKPLQDAAKCEGCHADAHSAQFDPKLREPGCLGCHSMNGFSEPVKFDHQKDTRYPLVGKHAEATCVRCHAKDTALTAVLSKGLLSAIAWPVRYRPVDQTCASCHVDQHLGQFEKEGATDCTRCHEVSEWKKTKFVHEPPFTDFLLEGKHAALACDKCHTQGEVGAAKPAWRYKGISRTCQSCHADAHDGAMRRYAQ